METVFLKMCFDVILSQRKLKRDMWQILRLHIYALQCSRGGGAASFSILSRTYWPLLERHWSQAPSELLVKTNHHSFSGLLYVAPQTPPMSIISTAVWWGTGGNGSLRSSMTVSSCVPSCFCRAVLLAPYLLYVSSWIFLSQIHVFKSTLQELKIPSPRFCHSDNECWKQKLELQQFASSACTSYPSDSSLGLHFLYGQLYETPSWSITLKFEFSCCFYYFNLRPFVFLPWNIKSLSFLRLNHLFL